MTFSPKVYILTGFHMPFLALIQKCHFDDTMSVIINFKGILFKHIMQKSSLATLYKSDLLWMPQSPTNEKSTLLQVMTWCHQVTGHCVIQCWPRSTLAEKLWNNCSWSIFLGNLVVLVVYNMQKVEFDIKINWCRFHQLITWLILYLLTLHVWVSRPSSREAV